MIVPFTDSTTAPAVYVNPAYVVTLRPDPVAMDRIRIIKLEGGESIRVQGDRRQVVDLLARTS
jgi:hypothetical protein